MSKAKFAAMDTHGTLRLDPVKVSACIIYKKYTTGLIFTKKISLLHVLLYFSLMFIYDGTLDQTQK